MMPLVGCRCCAPNSHRILAKLSVGRFRQDRAVFFKFASYDFSDATELGSYSQPSLVITLSEKKGTSRFHDMIIPASGQPKYTRNTCPAPCEATAVSDETAYHSGRWGCDASRCQAIFPDLKRLPDAKVPILLTAF
jgi:hypothetical protein